MVVDDDPILCDFVSMALADQGYETLTASNGVEALGLLEHQHPVLVLMDIGMPLLGGRDLAARIHEVAGCGVPCVLMSGSDPAPIDGDAGTIAGYLNKPFELDDLFALVRRCTA
jgi:CheY-like chemotaxis protein